MNAQEDSLTTNELAALWRHGVSSIRNWRSAGLLIHDAGNGSRSPFRYFYRSIDAIHRLALQDRPHLLPKFPTTAELVAYTKKTGRPALMTVNEVSNLLGYHRMRVYELAEDGRIIGFQPFGSGQWLFLTADVDEYAEQQCIGPYEIPPKGIPLDYIKRTLGRTTQSVYSLCNGSNPELLRVTDFRHQRLIVSYKSFLNYLHRNLNRRPDGTLCMTPIQWCRMRSVHPEELIRIRRFKERGRGGTITIREAVDNGSLVCLWGPKRREARIPAHIFYEWLEPPE